ncbi:MAG TPA: zinc ribbon domain-containing protein [Candidatus Bathyarchaeia archaeon]|nr:zinc ribbon domain-containing protein [Candidatus Bathyarchaeia archaeon]
MLSCPKCGSKVREDMNFCPKCGSSLKVEQAVAPVPAAPQPLAAPIRVEKQEKREKEEKGERQGRMEKEERYEKREYAFVGPLIGGSVLVLLGLAFYLMLTSAIPWEALGAIFFVIVGIIVIVGAVYAATMAARRHPQT